MRKALLTLSLLAVSVMSALGARAVPYKLVFGSIDAFKEDATATFEIVAKDATWEKKQSLKSYFAEDFEKCVVDATESFVIAFNQNSNGLRINNEAQDAKYKIVFTATNYHCSVGTFYKKFVGMWGTMEVFDVATGEKVCELELQGFLLGQGDYVEKTAFVNAHFGYAEYLQERIKKNKLKLQEKKK